MRSLPARGSGLCAMALGALGALVTLGAACGSGGGFPDARPIDAPPPTGTFSLAWMVNDAHGATLPCDQVGAESVTVLAHDKAVQGALPEVFVCSTLSGQSPGLAPGLYDFDFELVAASGTLATAPTQYNQTIESNGNLQLAPLVFAVDATGGLALNLSSGKPGGNCGLAASNGGGITATQITLTHASSGACEPITLAIGASAAAGFPASTYTINCTTPVNGPCIEADQTITATGVTADSYQLHVQAFQGATSCWSNMDSIVVPPLGATLTRTLNLLFATGTAGCM